MKKRTILGEVEILDEEGDADLPTLRGAIESHGPVWTRVLEGDLDPDRMVTRHRDDGSTFSAPLGIRLAQVIHHGTDHRSQICTALTTFGIEPPGIDVWAYGEAGGRLTFEPSDAVR